MQCSVLTPLSIVCDGEKTKLARNPASATPLATLYAVERDERTRRDKFSAHAKPTLPTRTHSRRRLSLSLLQVDKREGTVLRDAVRLIEILGVGSGRQAPGLKRAGWTRLLGAQGFHIQSWSYEIFIYRVTQNYGENLLLTKIWDVLPSSLGSR